MTLFLSKQREEIDYISSISQTQTLEIFAKREKCITESQSLLMTEPP